MMKKLKEDIIYPERSETHRTDTSAVRRLMTQLSSDWVIRDLSERDYGIDLKLEYFNDNKPTGKIVFLQVKGTIKKLQVKKDCVTLSKFPVHTLNYATLFPEPFVVVYLSINEGQPIYFAWLQKYISHELNKSNTWQNQGVTTIKIPICNNLLDPTGKEKLLKIASYNVMLRLSLEFLRDVLYWKRHFESLLKDNHDAKDDCIKIVNKLKAYEELYTVIWAGQQQPVINFNDVLNALIYFDLTDSDNEMLNKLESFSRDIQIMSEMLLDMETTEEFLDEQIGEKPY